MPESNTLRFPVADPSPALHALRAEVRAFLAAERTAGRLARSHHGSAVPDGAFSQALGRRGWIGMTWPAQYGGHGRSALERHVVTEELLAAGAPVRAHWVADRQSGPLLLRFGTEAQRMQYLPKIAAGECYFCIGMSEADSGSDLASIRTKAEPVDGGWRINGAKLWTSNAHRVHMMILFARTGPRGESRREGVSQFLVDLAMPGISVRPIVNMAGEHDFNEVVFDNVFVPAGMLVGTEGNGWSQVTSELVYERSGPDRWLSSHHVLGALADRMAPQGPAFESQAMGRLVGHLWTLQNMSMSVAGLMQQGVAPQVEAALVKDLGTNFEQQIPAVARTLVAERERAEDDEGDIFAPALDHSVLNSPCFTLRGGTREILRGIIAKGLGLR